MYIRKLLKMTEVTMLFLKFMYAVVGLTMRMSTTVMFRMLCRQRALLLYSGRFIYTRIRAIFEEYLTGKFVTLQFRNQP